MSDPKVVELRAAILGPEAPWKPTLLAIGETGSRAWVGWKIGAPLARRLGPARTAAVLEALGVERRSVFGGPATTYSDVSRRRFMLVAAGALSAGLLLFTGTFRRASASDLPPGTRSVPIAADQLDDMRDRLLASADVRNVLRGQQISVLQSGSRMPVEKFDRATATAPESDLSNSYALTGIRHLIPGGDRATTIGAGLPGRHVLVHREFPTNSVAPGSDAILYRVDNVNGLLHTISASYNGFAAEPVPDGVARVNSAAAAPDPCGGCADVNMHLSPSCATSKITQCVLSGVGCVGCAAACSETIGLACIACVGSTCGAAVVNCCEREGTPYCAVCKAMP